MKTETQNNPSENIKKLGELIKDVQVAMFTSFDPDKRLHTCPMATLEVDFEGDLWFFANKSSEKLSNIGLDPHVNLVYSCPKRQHYVSVTGRAERVDDREKAKELWSPAYKIWFEKGLEDPDLTLIKVTVEDAEYWDASGSTMVVLADYAKSLLGMKARAPVGEHRKVHLQ